MVRSELLDVARRCFDSGEALDDPRRRMRERQATVYFWQGCGIRAPGRPAPQLR